MSSGPGSETPLARGQCRFRLDLLGVSPLPLQGRLDGGPDSGQVALEEVVGGARLHAADRSLLVDRPGDDQEGDGGNPLPGQGERGHAVEPGKGVVGEDQVGLELRQLAEEGFPAVHPPGRRTECGPARARIPRARRPWAHPLESGSAERLGSSYQSQVTAGPTLPFAPPIPILEGRMKCRRCGS